MNLSPQSWRKVSELFEVAMEMNVTERDAWLENLSSTLPPDELPALDSLKRMLAQEARIETNDLLRTPPDFAGALLAESNSAPVTALDLQTDAEVGAYRLIRELGRGGMGSVWLATRSDGVLKRNVALKFPYAGPEQRQLVERLLQERDILSSLEHPNIARLYDADASNPSRPFLVLEYVPGIPIDEYCRANKLSIRQRLELFRQVFNAVQYAHSHLVIHRDLKPSNMLVTADGVVHLLDFGIAKVLSDSHSNSMLTELGGRVMTPNFASPEQIIGAPLTTASEVYALGIVLYELLTGARPYRLKREGRGSLEDAIAAADVAIPSDAAAAGHGDLDAVSTMKTLRGDLDTILLKALKKRPEERYATVAAFAEDVGRYLSGEPVIAQPDSTWYRLKKFTARNRLAVGAAAAIVASLGIGLSFALWQLKEARIAQQRAEDVKEFVASIFRSADPFFTGNHSMSAAELLTLARHRIDAELKDQPVSAIELLNIVGESQANLEQQDAARATFEKAIALGKERGLDEAQIANAESELGAVYLGTAELDKAKPLLGHAIPILRRSGPKYARALSDALQIQAYIDADEGHFDAAIAASKEAYQAVLATLGPKDSETILAKRNWAQELLQGGQLKEALTLAKQAFDESESTFAEGERRALVVETEGLYGRALIESNDLATGIEHLNKAIDRSVQIYGNKSDQRASFLSYVLRAQLRLGNYEGFIAAAKGSYEAATDERTATRPLTQLGDAHYRARHFAEAEPFSLRAVEAERKFDTGPGSWLPVALAVRAGILSQLGRAKEAESFLKEDAALVGQLKEPQTMPYWSVAGLAAALDSRWAESEQAYRRLLERTTDSPASARWRTDAYHGIGVAQLELGQLSIAEASFSDAEKAARFAYLNPTPSLADALIGLTRARLKLNRANEALSPAEEADRFWQTYDKNNRYAGVAAYWHGKALVAVGRTSEAREPMLRALAILKRSPVAADAKLVKAAS